MCAKYYNSTRRHSFDVCFIMFSIVQFDFWSDAQRKRLLQSLLQMCNKDQLYFVQTWFVDRVPFKHIDFSRLLTRQLCLRIFSYLDPKSLCRAAQVSWHWKFLTEDVRVGIEMLLSTLVCPDNNI